MEMRGHGPSQQKYCGVVLLNARSRSHFTTLALDSVTAVPVFLFECLTVISNHSFGSH